MREGNNVVYYTYMGLGPSGLLAAATGQGICKIEFGINEKAFFEWIRRKIGDVRIIKDEGQFTKLSSQLNEFINKERKKFDIEIDIIASDFQRKVYEEMERIPYGETISYKKLALKVGGPGYSRAVGNAANKNPLPIIIPCHRVVGSDGSLTGFGGGLEMKEYLLRVEKD